MLNGCEKKQSSIIDSVGYPPVLSSAVVTPDSVNLTNLPSGSTSVDLVITARVVHQGGESEISSVPYTVVPADNGDPVAAGSLLDDGVAPDLVQGDGVYSARVSLGTQGLLVGKYYCEVSAQDLKGYLSNTSYVPLVITQLNYPPVLSNVQAPDTIRLGGQAQQFKLMVTVTDPNGPGDVSKVFFNTFKPDGTPSGGNPFIMYDDGGANSSSGDAVKGDGIYTLTIVIDPASNPQLGKYVFVFEAIDRSGATSQQISHAIVVEP